MVAPAEQNWLFASPGEFGTGDGTRENPYGTLAEALGAAGPGNSIVLLDGVWKGDQTVEVSGAREQALWIRAENDGRVVIEGCWFLYDASDVIISGLVFRNTPRGAISVVGASCRTCFDNLSFLDCGRPGESTCTLFLGGSGSKNMLVRNCRFVRSQPDTEGVHSAVMITEGDCDEGAEANSAHLIRGNEIANYGYGVLVGAAEHSPVAYGHTIKYNRVTGATVCGIMSKCNDTRIVRNLVTGSVTGISLCGAESMVTDNRLDSCGEGIAVRGLSHTLTDNCIVGAASCAIHVGGGGEDAPPTAAVLISHNSFCDAGRDGPAGISVESGVQCMVDGNLWAGTGPAMVFGEGGHAHAVNNICTAAESVAPGFKYQKVVLDRREGAFRTASQWGARGVAAGIPGEVVFETVGEEDFSEFEPKEAVEEGQSGPRQMSHTLTDALFFDEDAAEEDMIAEDNIDENLLYDDQNDDD